jgi:hypothetical protein
VGKLEFLRSLSRRAPQMVVQRADPVEYNRILRLADMVLDNPVERRNAEKRTLAFVRKSESKKRKAG